MFLDASAMVAILAEESDAASLAARLRRAEKTYSSPIAIYEAVLGLARAKKMSMTDSQSVVERFIALAKTEILSIDAAIGAAAIAAFERFGRGRHPAALNMGDCFAYAGARRLGVPLLCKGADFPQTDIAVA